MSGWGPDWELRMDNDVVYSSDDLEDLLAYLEEKTGESDDEGWW